MRFDGCVRRAGFLAPDGCGAQSGSPRDLMQQRAALVAYEQSHRSYDVHRSRNLSQQLELCQRITADTPFGCGGGDYEHELIERDPIKTEITFQQVIDRLDFSRFGAVVRVSSEFEVTPYRAAWFGLSENCDVVFDRESYGYGALVSVPQQDRRPVEDDHFCARYGGRSRRWASSSRRGC